MLKNAFRSWPHPGVSTQLHGISSWIKRKLQACANESDAAPLPHLRFCQAAQHGVDAGVDLAIDRPRTSRLPSEELLRLGDGAGRADVQIGDKVIAQPELRGLGQVSRVEVSVLIATKICKILVPPSDTSLGYLPRIFVALTCGKR